MHTGFGQQQNTGVFGNQNQNQKLFSKPPSLNTNEIKQVVDGLNRPPFMCHLSLVEFDDKAPLEYLELVNRVLGHLDTVHNSIDIQKETQDKTQERICGFLKVLGYPCDFNPNFQRDVIHGEKKTIQHVLFWLISRLPDLQRTAYTAKFLVPLAIPDEFLVDEDMRETFQIYKDLQAEFQATHLNVETLRQESMNPTELKKEIQQLEQEKEQLLTKINLFKSKSNKEDFQQLLDATSKLRKEQEQDAKLNEKERELNNMIEFYESQLLTVKQRLLDAKKLSSESMDQITPDRMLDNLRNETRKNRELAHDILGRELADKTERLQRIEMVLQEPMTTQSELERLTSDVKGLQRQCQVLDDKIRQNTPADDKLAIYKSQATAVSKKKEMKYEEVKKLETEKMALEKLMNDKETEYARTRGGKYMKRDDFKQYAANLRGKNAQYKQMKKVLGEIKAEVNVLSRTENILKSRTENLEELMKKIEREKGIVGYSKAEEEIKKISEDHENLNQKKDQTLQEITSIVKQIETEVRDKKNQLAPEIKKLRGLRQQFQETEARYAEDKKRYDNVVMNLDQEKNRLDEEVKTLFDDYKQEETRFHQNNIQNEIYDAFLKRIGNEAKFVNAPDKRLSNEFKSYSEFFNAKLRQQENIVKDLKNHQRHIKDNTENYSLQVRLFKDLRNILEIKRRNLMQDGDDLRGYQDTQARGFDRFVVRD